MTTDVDAIKKSREIYLYDRARNYYDRDSDYTVLRCHRCETEFTILARDANLCPKCGSGDIASVKEDEDYIHTILGPMRSVYRSVMKVLNRFNLTAIETVWTQHEIEKKSKQWFEYESVWIIPTKEYLIGARTNLQDGVLKVFRIKNNDPALWQDESDEITAPYFASEKWTEKELTKGVTRHTSPLHTIGFFHLSDTKNRRINKTWREPSGWYEEAKCWMVITTFPELFTEEELLAAQDILLAHKDQIGTKLTKINRVAA